jgi:2-dehydro-3-deoxyphosphogalactonate aldolase
VAHPEGEAMTAHLDIASLDTMPLVAILRGLEPTEAVAVGEAICDAGFRCLEVPLNSPNPLESIARLRRALGDRALVGAGTVLSTEAVKAVAEAGGQLVVSPNTDPAVIQATKAGGMLSFPGFCTPTEAFRALDAGADALKLFPAGMVGMAGMQAMMAVLPKATRVYAVGGVDIDNLADWRLSGAAGFGIGSSLFKPGQDLESTRTKAIAFVDAATRCGYGT